ncbi:MAG: hypothetical protein IPM40_04215 [Gammaproteobacteria bacterium]|nr:hypothetical protein [Gammaproteobacteria bacterium]
MENTLDTLCRGRAAVAREAGADAIEIHCAHEALGYSFSSFQTNRRTDKQRSWRKRARFVIEALKRARIACRKVDKLLGAYASTAVESRHGGYDNLEMREMLYACIDETGLLDFVDIDTGHRRGAPSCGVCRPRTIRTPGFASSAAAARAHLALAGAQDRRTVHRPHQ